MMNFPQIKQLRKTDVVRGCDKQSGQILIFGNSSVMLLNLFYACKILNSNTILRFSKLHFSRFLIPTFSFQFFKTSFAFLFLRSDFPPSKYLVSHFGCQMVFRFLNSNWGAITHNVPWLCEVWGLVCPKV